MSGYCDPVRGAFQRGKMRASQGAAALRCAGAVVVSLVACGEGPLPPNNADGDGPGETTGEPSDPVEVALSASCAAAPELNAGRWKADFSGSVGNLGTLCGVEGPELFGRITMGIRGDLVARVGGQGGPLRLALTAPVCIDLDVPELCDDTGQELELRDLPLGTQVLARVGSDIGTPGWLDVEVRTVLAEGDVCEPESRGRCEATTTCEQDPIEGGAKICRPVLGDSCARPLDAVVDLASTGLAGSVMLPVDPAIGDEHAHSCFDSGSAARDAVVRLELTNDELVADDARLNLSVLSGGNGADIGLAARGPGCETLEEIACSAGQGAATSIEIDDLGRRARRGEPIYVFVEFAGGELPQGLRTIDLLWSVVDSP